MKTVVLKGKVVSIGSVKNNGTIYKLDTGEVFFIYPIFRTPPGSDVVKVVGNSWRIEVGKTICVACTMANRYPTKNFRKVLEVDGECVDGHVRTIFSSCYN